MQGEALKGHLELLLLASLADAPAHGYAVIERLRARSGGRFSLPEGTVYPALHRLERLGLLESHWSPQPSTRPRRLYALTAAGRAALAQRKDAWQAFVAGVSGIVGDTRA
jgi:DNA-binding PadR family transcriptional regulator